MLHWNVGLFLTQKDLEGVWLITTWQLTTTIAHHYVHMLEMKKKSFIKNKVMEAIVIWSVEKGALIPFTHV